MTRPWRPPTSRRSVRALIQRLGGRHPELLGRVVWDDFVRMCQREEITVRVRPLPECINGRLVRIGERPFIQLNARKPREARTIFGMHELCHFWCDDPGEACYYSDDVSIAPEEEFANAFAWFVTSTAREFMERWED